MLIPPGGAKIPMMGDKNSWFGLQDGSHIFPICDALWCLWSVQYFMISLVVSLCKQDEKQLTSL